MKNRGMTGKKHSEETRKKIGLANKGRLIGVHNSPATEFKVGMPVSKELRAKRSTVAKDMWEKGLLKRKLHTLETRQKISRNSARNKPWLGKHGEGTPNWKGGLTPLMLIIRHSNSYFLWRVNVFRRDNHTCRLCGKSKVYLEADHYPTMFAEIVRREKILTFADAMECRKLWDINNGRTLCRECHRKYGRRKVLPYKI